MTARTEFWDTGVSGVWEWVWGSGVLREGYGNKGTGGGGGVLRCVPGLGREEVAGG